MKAIVEDINYRDRSFIAYSFRRKNFEHPYHFHQEIEIVYINQGCGSLVVGNAITRFQEDDLVIIGSNIPHKFVSEEGDGEFHSSVIQFMPNCFGDLFFRLPELSRINQLMHQSKYGLILHTKKDSDVHKRIKKQINAKGLNFIISFLKLLECINEEQLALISSSSDQQVEIKASSKVDAAVNWMGLNYANDICLTELAAKINMNKNSFCRLFKSQIGKTPMQYIQEQRIEKACEQLANTSDSIIAIAYEVGYKNISSFNRQFKALVGKTPKDYRVKYQNLVN